ncbi:MAG: DUF5333 family protein [Pseudomonadota bacterium]
MIRTGLLAAAVVLALGACDLRTPFDRAEIEAQPARGLTDAELREELLTFARPRAIADLISGGCRDFGFNEDHETAVLIELRERLSAEPNVQARINAVSDDLPRILTEEETPDYLAENNIDTSDPDTLCAAGEKEVAAGSDIGAFLIPRT